MTTPHDDNATGDEGDWNPLNWAPTPYTEADLQAAAAEQRAAAQDQTAAATAGSAPHRTRRSGAVLIGVAVAALLGVAAWAIVPGLRGTSTAAAPTTAVTTASSTAAVSTRPVMIPPSTVRVTLTPRPTTATATATRKVTVTPRPRTATVTVHPRTTAARTTAAPRTTHRETPTAADPTTQEQQPEQPADPTTTAQQQEPAPAPVTTHHQDPVPTTEQAPSTHQAPAPVVSSSIAGDAGSVTTIAGGVQISGASWSGSPGPVSATLIVSGPNGSKTISMGSGSSGSWSGTVHTGAGTVRGHVHVQTSNQSYDTPTWSLPVTA